MADFFINDDLVGNVQRAFQVDKYALGIGIGRFQCQTFFFRCTQGFLYGVQAVRFAGGIGTEFGCVYIFAVYGMIMQAIAALSRGRSIRFYIGLGGLNRLQLLD